MSRKKNTFYTEDIKLKAIEMKAEGILVKAIKEKGIIMSMSRKGNPADNALIECFHGNLKHETFYLEPHLQSSNEIVSQTVIEYIKYYNETRIQAKLNYLSPINYRMIHNDV